MTAPRAGFAARVALAEATAHPWLDTERLMAIADTVLDLVERSEATLSLQLVDDREMRRLNRTHLGRDRTTNVLSFPLDPDGVGGACLGDVVLAPETIHRRALGAGRDPGADVIHLLVHGVLHLIGYDHVESRPERERMRARERAVLAELTRRGLTIELECPTLD